MLTFVNLFIISTLHIILFIICKILIILAKYCKMKDISNKVILQKLFLYQTQNISSNKALLHSYYLQVQTTQLFDLN